MEKLKELLKILEDLQASRSNIDSWERDKIRRAEWTKLDMIADKKERLHAYAKIDNKFILEDAREKNIKELISIAKHNIRVFMYKSVLPEILPIIAKYENKQAGTVTSKKLFDELKAAFNNEFYVYVHNDEITIQCVDSVKHNISTKCYTIYDNEKLPRFIDNNNKYQNVKIELINSWYKNYIEDAQKYINEQKTEYESIKNIYNELEKKISAYNHKFNIEGFKNLNIRERI